MATAVLRAPQPGSIQITGPPSTTHSLATGIHPHVQQRGTLIPVKATNPAATPPTKPASPAVSTVIHNPTDPHGR